MIARVLPLTSTRAVRGLFDYRVAPEQSVAIGSLLRVPFAGRELVAIVAEMAEHSEVAAERLATVTATLPARLPPDLVELAQWMAGEYCSTPARALGVLMPPGAARGATREAGPGRDPEREGENALHDQGARLTDGQREALQKLSEAGGPLAAGDLGTSLLRRLEGRGLVTITAATTRRRPARHDVSAAAVTAPPLTPEQQAAVSRIVSSPGERLLLHGVTGSGKTEVYLAAAEAALAAGRTAIILVPEIGLTPQALQRFEARLGQVVAVLHSGMSEGARHDEWMALARGEARVCVGPRSAVFAPLENIGLIIVDEEHESSYKHEGDPRYDARHVAEQRARQHGATLVYGSATPRPESIPSTVHLRLDRRVDGRPLPAVEIVDMRSSHNALHSETTLALHDVRRRGGKAIVLLNRRGWSNFLSCGDCGHVWMCPNCEVALVLHRASRTVSCHHCGHHEKVPRQCPKCGSVSVARHGAGTERLEHELAEALEPDPETFPILRLDADVSGIDAGARILERFQTAPAGVLIGTQMVAKGHDFPDVGLGVVVDADQTLRFPDFRAEERTFALVTQLAGRTGRGGGATGRVIVQTRSPGARPITLAARHDSDTFLRGELERRRALHYPPFATLIRIVTSAVDSEAPYRAAVAMRQQLEANPGGRDRYTLLGPAPLFMLRGKHRAQLLIKTTDRAAAVAAVGAAVDTLAGSKPQRDVAFSVDVDPQ